MRRGLSLVKKGVFSAVIELLASVAGARITGRRFSSARLQRQRDALVANAGRVAINPNAQWLQDEILHPYVGYTPVPRGAGTSAGVAGPVAAAPPTRGPDRVTIAFVGGSFAVAFAEHGAPRLLARLSELPAFRGKTLVPLNLAVGGYKQPQQGAVAAGAEWLTEFWASKRTRAWILAQTPLLHVYGHYFEARVAAGLWGARSL